MLQTAAVWVPNQPIVNILIGNEGHIGKPFRLPQPFVICKEKRLVFTDRSTEGKSKLVAFESRLPTPKGVVLPCGGVESAVAEKFVDAAMQSVGPGLGDHVHDAPAGSAEFRAVIGSQNLKLAHPIHAQKPAAGAPRRSKLCAALDVHAVQKPGRLVRTRSGDGHSCPKSSSNFSRTRVPQ